MKQRAILFPGQGAQKVGMGADFADRFGSAREIFEEANAILGLDLRATCFEGPDDELTLTRNCQPAIFTTSAAIVAALGRLKRTISQRGGLGGAAVISVYRSAGHLAAPPPDPPHNPLAQIDTAAAEAKSSSPSRTPPTATSTINWAVFRWSDTRHFAEPLQTWGSVVFDATSFSSLCRELM